MGSIISYQKNEENTNLYYTNIFEEESCVHLYYTIVRISLSR